MKKFRAFAPVAALLLVSSSARGLSLPDQAQAEQTLAMDTSASSESSDSQLEAKILTKLHKAGQIEMMLAQAALGRTVSEGVKDFAEMLIKDHREADAKVLAVSRAADLPLLEPAVPSAEESSEALAEQLAINETFSDTDGFEQSFLLLMAKRHASNIMKLTNALAALPDGQVKDLIAELLPLLKTHLAMAQNMLPEELRITETTQP